MTLEFLDWLHRKSLLKEPLLVEDLFSNDFLPGTRNAGA